MRVCGSVPVSLTFLGADCLSWHCTAAVTNPVLSPWCCPLGGRGTGVVAGSIPAAARLGAGPKLGKSPERHQLLRLPLRPLPCLSPARLLALSGGCWLGLDSLLHP